MMRNTSLLQGQVALLVCLYLLLGAGEVSAQASDPASQTLGRIIWIEPKRPEGALMVRQAKQVDPVNAAEGMLVRRGYMLILDPAARATVICGDGKLRQLAPGPHGCPCTQPCTPKICGINYEGSTVGMTRGPDTDAGLFPAVISPRKTKLRDLRPAISWAPIAGAKEKTVYHVTLYGELGKVIWTKDVVAATRLIYPDDVPPLEPGQTYKVVVTSEGQSSQQDRTPGLGFTTLTASQARALADEEIKVKELRLPEAQTGFLIANLYASRQLYSEAMGLLEDLYTTMKEAAVAAMLGDLYAATGLNREAEKKYLEALRLIPANDLDGLGAIQKNLGQVYEFLGIIDRARARLGEARKAYQRLGNRAMVRMLLEAERRLKKPRAVHDRLR